MGRLISKLCAESETAPRANPANPANQQLAIIPISRISEISSESESSNDAAPDKGMEVRRTKVLAKLASDPTKEHAYLVEDASAEPVTVAIAIRGVGTCELLIPIDRYNPLKMIAVIDLSEKYRGRK